MNLNYETRLQAFETAYQEIIDTACRYFEDYAKKGGIGDLKQALAVICMANQMALAFNVDFEIRNECFSMI